MSTKKEVIVPKLNMATNIVISFEFAPEVEKPTYQDIANLEALNDASEKIAERLQDPLRMLAINMLELRSDTNPINPGNKEVNSERSADT